MDNSKTMPLVRHLEELRKVIIISALATVISSAIVYLTISEQLFKFISGPIRDLNLPLIYTGVAEAFYTKLKTSIIGGVILAFPVMAWAAWGFVAPALDARERKQVYFFVPSALFLFITGVLFAYFTVFRVAARFLLITAGQDLQAMISISNYVSFLLSFLIPFGLIFELPLLVLLLTRTGLLTPQYLIKNRRYALLFSFVAAAVLTPGPDMFSQVLMALPVVVLYELSILLSWLVNKRRSGG